MEPVVRLPLSGWTLVEIRRSRPVVIAARESCFDYGLFLPFSSIRPNPFLVGGHASDAILGTWGGVTLHVDVARWKGLIDKYLFSCIHILSSA